MKPENREVPNPEAKRHGGETGVRLAVKYPLRINSNIETMIQILNLLIDTCEK